MIKAGIRRGHIETWERGLGQSLEDLNGCSPAASGRSVRECHCRFLAGYCPTQSAEADPLETRHGHGRPFTASLWSFIVACERNLLSMHCGLLFVLKIGSSYESIVEDGIPAHREPAMPPADGLQLPVNGDHWPKTKAVTN
jgi:hypothetical protein